MGERWRALSAVEKKKYEDMASEDKIRFNDEMQKFMAQKASAQPAALPVQAPVGAQAQFLPHDMYGMQDAAMPHHYADPAYTTHYEQHYQHQHY
jgi:hypothetical protein